MKNLFFLFALIFFHISFSQNDVFVDPTSAITYEGNSINNGILSFFVTDAETGYGNQAEILFHNEKDSFLLQTNEGGHLIFNGSVGKYNITISSAGYNSLTTYFFIEQGKTVNITAIMEKQFKNSVEFMDYSTPIVEGYVIDFETGKPLKEVEVELINEGLFTKTNKDGFFSVSPSHFSTITNPEDKAIRSDFSFSIQGYETHTLENLLIIPDKIKLKIALKKGFGNNTEKYFQHVLDGTKQDVKAYEKSFIEENSINQKSSNYTSLVLGCTIPSTIRVGVSCSCTSCSGVNVMSLQHYTESGLDNEWISSWQFNSLKAGSFPYRTYGGYYVYHPVSSNFDIASSTCNQAWGSTIYSNAQSAAQATANQILTKNNVIARSEYSAQNNYGGGSNCSNCFAGGSGAYNCYSDNVCCGKTPAGHGRGMCQWGTQYWAQAGKNDSWMLNHYYFATIGYSICGGAPSTPPAPIISSTNNCGSKTLMHASAPSGITYYWQGTSCGTSTSNSSTTLTVIVSGTYYLRARDNASGAWSSCSSKAVTINSNPPSPPIPSTTANLCGPQILTRAIPPSGQTYFWQGTSCGTIASNASVTYSAPATGTYYLRARTTAGCWSGACASRSVNVTPRPAIPPVPAASSNSCGPVTLTVPTAPAGEIYYWQSSGSGTSTANPASTVTVTSSSSYFLNSLNTYGCWSPGSSAVNVTIYLCPTGLTATVGACPNANVTVNWIDAIGTWTLEVSLDPAFNELHSKSVANASTVTIPAGFNPGLVLQPGATYYWRINVGGNSYFQGASFTVPFCDLSPPATVISNITGWQSSSFPVSFSDTDNVALGTRFYSVSDFNGMEWRANSIKGFFNDNFDNNSLHPDWVSYGGTWSTDFGFLSQTDESNANTNLSTPLVQNLSNKYLYHWNAKIEGNGTGRALGFHFFCDNSTLSNRGNSYAVLFDVDAQKLRFYKASSNVLNLEKEVPFNFIAAQYYDFKVIYDRISGKMDVYINDALAESWVDYAPLSTGNAVSFKTVNSSSVINYLEVFRSRLPSESITVGAANTNLIRYENSAPSFSAGKIKSVVTDWQGNLSEMLSTPVNIDWTAPSAPVVNDGTGADISTTYIPTELAANWMPAVDTNSGVTNYYYSIGTAAGDTNLIGWTDNFSSLTVIKNNLALQINQLYYFNLKAENGAGIVSTTASSNGQQLVVNTTGIDELKAVEAVYIYPNPFRNITTINYNLLKSQFVEVALYDVLGRKIKMLNDERENEGNHKLVINATDIGITEGVYFIIFKIENTSTRIKIICNSKN